jgi:hypothetical protein
MARHLGVEARLIFILTGVLLPSKASLLMRYFVRFCPPCLPRLLVVVPFAAGRCRLCAFQGCFLAKAYPRPLSTIALAVPYAACLISGHDPGAIASFGLPSLLHGPEYKERPDVEQF